MVKKFIDAHEGKIDSEYWDVFKGKYLEVYNELKKQNIAPSMSSINLTHGSPFSMRLLSGWQLPNDSGSTGKIFRNTDRRVYGKVWSCQFPGMLGPGIHMVLNAKNGEVLLIELIEEG